MQTAAYYATAAAAGIMGGWVFTLIWARLAPASVQRQFWSTMSNVAQSMLVAEHSHEFLDLYRRLGVALWRYLGRNVGGLILASLPLIALGGVLSVSAYEPWLHDASWQLMFLIMAAVGGVAAMIRRRRT